MKDFLVVVLSGILLEFIYKEDIFSLFEFLELGLLFMFKELREVVVKGFLVVVLRLEFV